jgi:hypothetical protein
LTVPSSTNSKSHVRNRSRIGSFFAALASDLGEAAICLGLGIRTALAPALLLRSAILGGLLGGFWFWLFWQHLSNIGEFSIMAAATLVMGLILPLGGVAQRALVSTPVTATTSTVFDSLGHSTYNAGVHLFNIGSILVYVLALSAVVVALLWALAYLASSGLVSRSVLWQHIRDRTRRSYPALQAISPPDQDIDPIRPRHLRRVALVIGLLVPFVSGVLLIGLICYAVVRLFFDSLMRDRLTPGQRPRVLRKCVGPSVALGFMVIVVALIPVLNLLTPVLLGSAAGHMYYRALFEVRKLA